MFALASCPVGSGATLYAGGRVWGLADWEATVNRLEGGWCTEIGHGSAGHVLSFLCLDDGATQWLYAGGYLFNFEGIGAYGIARWDGSAWSAIEGLNGSVQDMVIFDDGTGPALYVGGDFPNPMPPNSNVRLWGIAKWTGTTWAPLGGGMMLIAWEDWGVNALAVFDDGSGPALYAAGDFLYVYLPETDELMRVNNIARWDGTAWSIVGGGTTPNAPAPIFDMVVYDDGSGPALYVGGRFTTAGGVSVNNIARWDGAAWSDVGGGVTGGGEAAVRAFTVFDDGSGPALYAAGRFTNAGGVSALNVAKWDGANWNAIGAELDGIVYALASYPSTGDPNLIIEGAFQFDFSTLADGGAMYALFPGLPGPVLVYVGQTPVPGSILRLAAGGSLRIGTMDVTMPSTLGPYAIDVLGRGSPTGGSVLLFGFGGPLDPFTEWSAVTGDLTGLTYGFDVVSPDPPVAPAPESEASYAKDRYLSVVPTNGGTATALRVTLTASTQFPDAVGRKWWVGSPSQVSENSGYVMPIQGWPTFSAAAARCAPFYADWEAVVGNGVPLHIYGRQIVPDATYAIEAIHSESDISNDMAYSDPLFVITAKWGDIVSDCSTNPCGPPDGVVNITTDVTAVLDKAMNRPGAPIKARCDVAGPLPIKPLDPDRRVDVSPDVTRALEAFQGLPYPFPAPAACP